MAKGFKKRYFSLVAIAATVSAVTLHAKESRILDIQKVVVSANHYEESLEGVTDDVEVITAEEIKEKGYTTLPELLKAQVGIDAVQTGGIGQPLSLYLQGLNPDKTLILIDGIRFNDPSNLNGAALELIDLANIERIEIVKGSQSGIWGADAIGGVINIITKGAKEGVNGAYSVEGGSFGTLNTSAHYSYQKNGDGIIIALSKYKTDGFSAYSAKRGDVLYGVKASDLPFEDDGFENRKIDLKLKKNLENYGSIEASLLKIASSIHYDDFGADAPDSPYTTNKVDDTLYSFSYNFNDLDIAYKKSQFKRSQYGGYEASIKELEAKKRFEYSLGRVQVGAGWQRFFQKRSAGIVTNDGYQNRYIFLSSNLKFDQFLVNMALRSDNYDKFDDKITYKLGMKYKFSRKLFIASNVATGYKAPSIFQLNYNVTQGLQPEKSLSYNFIIGSEHITLTYFNNKVKDLITYIDPDNDWNTPNDYYFNASGTSYFKGLEAKLSYDFLETIATTLTYTHLSAKDAQGKDLPRRAKDKIGYSLSWYPTDKHTININGYYIGKREDVDGSSIGKYNVTNLSLQHNFAPHFTGFIKVNNLFNRFYQEANGYATANRSYYIGVRASY